MKKTLRLFAPTLAILMLVVYLSSCSLISILKGVSDGLDNKDTDITDSDTVPNTETETFADDTTIDIIKPDDSSNDTEETQNPEVTTPVVIENIADYVLVRPDLASTPVKNAIMDLRDTIEDKIGASLDLSTDYNPKSTYEILIGDLIRDESKNALSNLLSRDYVIKLDGTKIIIAGGSEDSLITAINKFKDMYIVTGKVLVPTGKGLIYSHQYALGNISINGKSVSEYKIYSVNEACAEKLSVNISEKFSGQIVEVAKKMSNNGPYIVLEPTSLNYTHYDVKFDGNNLIVSGSYKSCYEFLDYFVKKGSKNVNITEKFSGDIDKPDLYTKEELMYVLETVYDEDGRLIIGQESNGNIKTPYAGSIDLFYEGTGEYPGIVGIDLSWAGLCLYKGARAQEKATDELKSQTFCEMVEYAEMGGIFTVGSHFLNPNPDASSHRGYGEAKEVNGALGKEVDFLKVITPGTPSNRNFQAELNANIEFLKACDDVGLALIWRPFHEMNASWFWWSLCQTLNDGDYNIDPTYFVKLWKYVYNKFEDAGLDNLIWHYCPDVSWIDNLKPYPGDDFCDIVGSDWYTSGNLELWYYDSSTPTEQGLKTYPLKNLMSKNKPIGIGEMGHWNVHGSSLDYVTDLTAIFKNGGKLAYAMTWTVSHSFKNLGDGAEAMAPGMFIDRDELFNKYFPAARAALGN